MALSTHPYKGTEDLYPEDKRLQKHIFGVIRKVAEQHGYEEYSAPSLESSELYQARAAGDQTANPQTYSFHDRVGKHMTFRPDVRPSASRMVAAKRDELIYPLRWYNIADVWRYEGNQHSELREQWQPSVDIFGMSDLLAETEILQMVDTMLQTYGARHDMYSIRLNSRTLIDFIFKEYLTVSDVQAITIARLINRKHVMPAAEFAAEIDALFTPSQRDNGCHNKLIGLLKIKTIEHLPEIIRQHSAALELKELIHALHGANVPSATFDFAVMPQFDYYTGTIFEVFGTHPNHTSAILGGGRYDNLVGSFGVRDVPAVGFSFDHQALQQFLKEHDLLPPLKSEIDLYVIVAGNALSKARHAVREIRDMDANVVVATSDDNVEQQYKTATRQGIRYAMLISDSEAKEEQYIIKNLLTGDTERHSLARSVSIIKDYRGSNDDD